MPVVYVMQRPTDADQPTLKKADHNIDRTKWSDTKRKDKARLKDKRNKSMLREHMLRDE